MVGTRVLQGGQRWGEGELDPALSPEAPTAAVVPRTPPVHHIERMLAGRFGSAGGVSRDAQVCPSGAEERAQRGASTPSTRPCSWNPREGWRSLVSVFFSIWRMRSRVRPKWTPMSSRVCSSPSMSP